MPAKGPGHSSPGRQPQHLTACGEGTLHHGATFEEASSTSVNWADREKHGVLPRDLQDQDGLTDLGPYWRVNNPTVWDFCVSMIGRAVIEGSNSNVAMNAWLPQASYPSGNFSHTSS